MKKSSSKSKSDENPASHGRKISKLKQTEEFTEVEHAFTKTTKFPSTHHIPDKSIDADKKPPSLNTRKPVSSKIQKKNPMELTTDLVREENRSASNVYLKSTSTASSETPSQSNNSTSGEGEEGISNGKNADANSGIQEASEENNIISKRKMRVLHSVAEHSHDWSLFRKLELPGRLRSCAQEPLPEMEIVNIHKNDWRPRMTGAHMDLEMQVLQCMHDKTNYLQNPRYSRDRKQFEAWRLFRLDEPNCSSKYKWLNPTMVSFDGFGQRNCKLQTFSVEPKAWHNDLTGNLSFRIIKPSTSWFKMTSPEVPFQGRVMISGTTCNFDITFSPTDILERKDVVRVSSEMGVCLVQLAAIHPLPRVVVPSTLEFGVCLTGHSCSKTFNILSDGAGSEFSFNISHCQFENTHPDFEDPRFTDLESGYRTRNIMYCPPFVLYPMSFKLEADKSTEIIVLFRPHCPGKFVSYIQLKTITDLRWNIQVTATGVDLGVALEKINGRGLKPGQRELGISFEQVTVFTTVSAEVAVTNLTPISLRYYWSVQPRMLVTNSTAVMDDGASQEMQDNLLIFSPKPCFGTLVAGAETTMRFHFTPTDPLNYQQTCCFFVDTRCVHPSTSQLWPTFRDSLNVLENDTTRAKYKEFQHLCPLKTKGYIDATGIKDPQKIILSYENCCNAHAVDNRGAIFKMMELDLAGSGSALDVAIVPPVLVFSGILTLGAIHSTKVQIINKTSAKLSFSWERPRTPYGDIKNSAYPFPVTGTLEPMGTKEVELKVKARKVGRLDLDLRCFIECPGHGGRLARVAKVAGHIRGPQITMSPPMLNFGLVQIDSVYSLEIVLTNKSLVAPENRRVSTASFRIFSTPNSSTSASTTCSFRKQFVDPVFDEALQGIAVEAQAPVWIDPVQRLSRAQSAECVSSKPVSTEHQVPPEHTAIATFCTGLKGTLKSRIPFEEDLEQVLKFNPSAGEILPGESKTVRVDLCPTLCGYMRLAVVCEVADGLSQTQYAVARAHIDAPEACLLPCVIDLRTRYINIPFSIHVTIRNLKELPACFSWPFGERVGAVNLDVEVNPSRGEIPPLLERNLEITLTPRTLGLIETILICNVYKMLAPLGLELKAEIVEVRCSYHVLLPPNAEGHQKSGRGTSFSQMTLGLEELSKPVELSKEQNPNDYKEFPIPCLDFGQMRPLGKAQCLRLVVRNHSPIECSIQAKVGQYISEPNASLIKDDLWILSSMSGTFSYLPPTCRDPFQSAMRLKNRQMPLIGTHDDLHHKFFTSAGKEMLWRRVEGAMHEALIQEAQPVAFLVHPANRGVLTAWGEWTCEVICFSCLPGTYLDILTVKVGSLKTVELPLEVEIVGSPLVCRSTFLEPRGLQQLTASPGMELVWSPKPSGHQTVTKRFWIANQSPYHMEVHWEPKRPATVGGKSCSLELVVKSELLVHLELQEKLINEDSTVVVFLKEHVCLDRDAPVRAKFKDYLDSAPDLPFCVQPTKQVVHGHSSASVDVTFHTTQVSRYNFVLIGSTRILDGRHVHRKHSRVFEFDRLDEAPAQYVYRRPSEKHVCEHVVTFYSKRDSQFSNVLVRKTSIIKESTEPEDLGPTVSDSSSRGRQMSRMRSNSRVLEMDQSDYQEVLEPWGGDAPKPITKENSFSCDQVQHLQARRISKLQEPKSMVSLKKDLISQAHGEFSKLGRISTLNELGLSLSLSQDMGSQADHEIFNLGDRMSGEDSCSSSEEILSWQGTQQRQPSCAHDLAHESSSKDSFSEQEPSHNESSDDIFLELPVNAVKTQFWKTLTEFGHIPPIRVSLTAIVTVPRLHTNVDECSFLVFGSSPSALRCDTQSLYITNHYPHELSFEVLVPECYELLNISCGVLNKVIHGNAVQRLPLIKTKDLSFDLQSGHTLQFNIIFRPMVEEFELDPLNKFTAGDMILCYSDTCQQVIPLHSEVQFPEVTLVTDILWFGSVLRAKATQQMDFTLTNPTYVDADWRIVTEQSHLKTVALATAMTTEPWDDSIGLPRNWPIIWFASSERGTIPGKGLGCPANKQTITFTFAPFDVLGYRIVVWVEVRIGRGHRLILKGEGVDESWQPPAALNDAPPPTLAIPARKSKRESIIPQRESIVPKKASIMKKTESNKK